MFFSQNVKIDSLLIMHIIIVVFKLLLVPLCMLKKFYRKVYLLFHQNFSLYILQTQKAHLGKGVIFDGCAFINISRNSHVEIGDQFRCVSNSEIAIDGMVSRIIVHTGAELYIGHHSGISNTSIHCYSKIHIGNHVNIGANCLIMDTDFHSLDWKIRMSEDDTMRKLCSPIIIENNVFIGARCIILKGVTIGSRSIIAAGSVVTKNIPPDCVAGGNPCKIIKYLRENEENHLEKVHNY